MTVKNLYKYLGVFGLRGFSGFGIGVPGEGDGSHFRAIPICLNLGYICIQGGFGRYVLSRASYRGRFFSISFSQGFTIICLDPPFLYKPKIMH